MRLRGAWCVVFSGQHWADRYEGGYLLVGDPWPRYPISGDLSWSASVRTFTAVVERDPETGLYVGFVPGFPGAHSQAESLDELQRNLQEVVALLLEDGEPKLEAEFVGIQTVAVS